MNIPETLGIACFFAAIFIFGEKLDIVYRAHKRRALSAAGGAAVELFRGTMVCHSAVVYRDDSPGNSQRISFAGDAWLGYVPIRMSDTICVEERLPPGAAAVLINQNHTYRDLFMPIDSTEKCLFDAIDGKCSIGNIVERTSTSSQKKSQIDIARKFFERLWWYDQVVFDASQHKEDSIV